MSGELLMQLWPVLLALLLAAVAWGKTQGDVSTLKHETAELRKEARRHDRILTALAAHFRVRILEDDEGAD